MNGPELMTVKEASQRLKVSRAKILLMCQKGELLATRMAGDWRISKPALERLIVETLNAPKAKELKILSEIPG